MVQELELVGQCLPFQRQLNKTLEFSNSTFFLMFFFRMTDCGVCLKNEIATWNKFIQSVHVETCQVLGLTTRINSQQIQRLRETLNINFPVVAVPEFEDILAEQRIPFTPALLFGDFQSQKILSAFFATPIDKSSDWFESHVRSFLKDCE